MATRTDMMSTGNTPTGVGKTGHVLLLRRNLRKHPHGRGEDLLLWQFVRSRLETPPRAWGRLKTQTERGTVRGNTPTGVGKTA